MATVKTLSVEDANLSKVAQITARAEPYKDIDLTFDTKKNGDIFKKTDASSVKQAVLNLILTNYYEKPFNPFFGGNIRALLFELADDFTKSEVENAIETAINNYEPRVQVLDVNAQPQPDNNSIFVRIRVRIRNTTEIVTIETSLSRLR